MRLTIRYYEFGVDLREITHSIERIALALERAGLSDVPCRHCDCAIFFNNAREFGGANTNTPKCRLLVRWHNHWVLMIPPVDHVSQVSCQQQVNSWISKEFTRVDDGLQQKLANYDELSVRRIAVEQAIAARRAA